MFQGETAGMSREEIVRAALALPEGERAVIAAALLESLEPEVDPAIDEAWRDEIRRRLTAIEAGEEELIPWEEAQRMMFRG